MEEIQEIVEQLRERIQNLEYRIEELSSDVEEQDDAINPLQDDDLRDEKVEFTNYEDETVAVDADATPGYLGDTGANGVLRTDGSISYTDGGDFVTLGTNLGPPTGGESLPDCTEYPNPWTVAGIAGFPWRFKKTSDAGGVIQYKSLAGEEWPLITYRDTEVFYSTLSGQGFPEFGAITVSSDGTRRFYLNIDLTIKTTSAITFVDTTDSWATIMALNDSNTEIVPILEVVFLSSVIQYWGQMQWGTKGVPGNA